MVVDVAVIGGGISGLAAAYELQKRGLRVRVFEASDRPGGVIQTDRFDGWVVDRGPDSLLVQKPAAIDLCTELGLGDRLVSTLEPRRAYVVRNHQLHVIPEGSFLGFPIRARALARSSLLSTPGKVRLAGEVFVPKRRTDDDESIASFVRRRFGNEAVDYVAEPLLAGIHAGDVDRLSVQSLFPRLVEAEQRAGSVIRAFRALRQTPSARGAFVSLPGGVADLVDSLHRALTPGTLITSAPVTRLRSQPAFEVQTATERLHPRAVVVAAPAYAAAQMLSAEHPELAGLCAEVPYASTATIAFGFRRDQIDHSMQGSGFVVPRVEGGPLLAATWVSAKWPHRSPDGHALLRAFLGGGRDPHRLEQDDRELIRSARESLVTIMRVRGQPLFERVARFTRQSPQFEVGHTRRLAGIDRCLDELPGLFLTGSGFRSIGIPDCIADARATARRAAAFLTPSPT